MADLQTFSNVRRITSGLRAILFNFRMGLGLVVLLPCDAVLLSSQTNFPTPDGTIDFCFWFAILTTAAVALWRRLPRARQTAREAQLGLNTPAEPRDASELLFCEVAVLLGLFLAMLSRVKGDPPVGRNWELGFLAGGLALGALGLYRMYRYAHPSPPDIP